MAAFAKSWRRE
jgi:hypothetical protein